MNYFGYVVAAYAVFGVVLAADFVATRLQIRRQVREAQRRARRQAPRPTPEELTR